VALLAALALVALAPGASARAETWVRFPVLLRELRTGDVIRVIINPARTDVEIKFRNLQEWHAYYPPAAQRELQRTADARHIRLLFTPRHTAAAHHSAAVHHHLRYIAAAVLAALAIAAAAVALSRGRSRRARSHG
jgi:hypothetical protein